MIYACFNLSKIYNYLKLKKWSNKIINLKKEITKLINNSTQIATDCSKFYIELLEYYIPSQKTRNKIKIIDSTNYLVRLNQQKNEFIGVSRIKNNKVNTKS